jgi:outer membrane biosynthesis protein TonB
MTDQALRRWQDQPRDRHESVTIRTVWLTLALSLLIHVAALFVLIPHMKTVSEDLGEGEASAPVQVQLTPPPSVAPPAPPEPTRETQAAIAPPTRPPKAATPPPPRQAMVVPRTTTPAVVMPPPPPPAPPPVAAVPPAPAPPPTGDLASFIAEQRRARGETAASTVDEEKERYNRNIAANLPTAATGTAGRDRRNSGGIFEIKRLAYDDAVFQFYGWNKEVGQRTPQSFEVRLGNNPDMRIAVVRKMIVIVREHEQGDFVWESRRLGHNVTLSARVPDTQALEEFMLQEFFDSSGRPH